MDSGVGGLSVFGEIRRALPQGRFIYYSDNAYCPYGDKSPEFIRERLRFITELLVSKGVQIMVLACNTATSAAIAMLRREYDIPFIGMEPAVKPAAIGTRTGVIGVLATAGTLSGSKYLDIKDRFAAGVRIEEQVGRGFVELVESGRLEGPEAERIVGESLGPLLQAGADHIVLGCTHYPFLLPVMQKVAESMGHPEVEFIDPAPAVAARLLQVLAEKNIGMSDEHPGVELISSGDPIALQRTYRKTQR